jgi:hypothetical protein
MGGQQSQPIQLTPAPGFEKRKANTFPGYEKYDFGAYEIWGPYKKTPIPGPFGSSSWQPMNKTVDGALVLDACTIAEGRLKPYANGSISGTLLRSYTSFSTKPDVGSDQPACYEDNMTLFAGPASDDGLFYIHYKHPMFARIISNTMPRAGFSGLIPTLFQSKNLNKAKSVNNVGAVLRQRPSPEQLGTMSLQNIAETGYLLYKGKKALNRVGYQPLSKGLQAPLDQAVRIINTRAAILNFGKRTLGGRKIKHNRTYKRKAKI